jgi:hypothetical protein
LRATATTAVRQVAQALADHGIEVSDRVIRKHLRAEGLLREQSNLLKKRTHTNGTE